MMKNILVQEAALITATNIDNEGSSKAPNLNNPIFKAIQVEAECDED